MNNNKISQLRIDNNLTQSEMSEKLGINQSTLSQIESGKLKPSLKVLNKISNEFNVSVDWLISLDENPSVNPSNISNKNNNIDYWDTSDGKEASIVLMLFEIEEAIKVFEAFANKNGYKPNKSRYDSAFKTLKIKELNDFYNNTVFNELSNEFLLKYSESLSILYNAITSDIYYIMKHYLRQNNLLIDDY